MMKSLVKLFLFCLALTINMAARADADEEYSLDDVYLVPGWISYSIFEESSSCQSGQWSYRLELLRYVRNRWYIAPDNMKSYYNKGTLLGYFSDNESPAEMLAIAKKVQPIVDKDLEEMRAQMAKKSFFLLVGDYSMTLTSGTRSDVNFFTQTFGSTGLPSVSEYQWEKGKIRSYVMVGGETYIGTINATPQQWSQNFEKYFGPRGTEIRDLADQELASRVLLNWKLELLVADIFNKKTGKSLLRWSSSPELLNLATHLVPELPASAYDFNPYKCESLNPAYYSDRKSKSKR